MTLGSDVSGLSTTAASAAARGLSIVVPLYNEAAGLAMLHERLIGLARTLQARYGLASEVVYVDDGSADNTLAIARTLAAEALDIQVVSLSRNFGKEAALDGGAGPCPPRRGAVHGRRRPASADLVEKLVSHWIDDGYDVVYTAKAHRDNETFLRRQAVHGFYALINWGARQKIPEDAGDFRLLSPRAATALRQLPERNRFFKGLSNWIGFRQIRVDYEPAPRAHGVTTFSPGRLIGLSIEGLTSFSVAPLRFASLLGVLLAVSAFMFGLTILWEVLTTGKQVPGYPSLMIGLMTIGGVQLIMIGIVGEYIGKILSELKARPIYFVAEHSEKRANGETALMPPSGPPPNERRRAAATDLAVRRRLRVGRGRQPRHSRPDLPRPSQCDVGDGGRRCDRPRRGRRTAGGFGGEPALRHRPARDIDGAVPSAVDVLPATPWRTVPAVSGHAAIGPAAAARS